MGGDPHARMLGVGVFRQKIHFVLRREADYFGHIRKVMELVEQRLQLSGGRHPEQGTSRLVRFVEIAMRNASRQAYQVSGFGLHPNAIEFEIQYALLHKDKLLLCRMNVDRDKLSRVTVGLKGECRVGYCLRKINLTEDVPGLACKSLSIPGNAFFERCHI